MEFSLMKRISESLSNFFLFSDIFFYDDRLLGFCNTCSWSENRLAVDALQPISFAISGNVFPALHKSQARFFSPSV